MSIYYLYEYGSTLEKAFGTSDFLAFLVSQVGMLSVLAGVFMTPFFANSVITGEREKNGMLLVYEIVEELT